MRERGTCREIIGQLRGESHMGGKLNSTLRSPRRPTAWIGKRSMSEVGQTYRRHRHQEGRVRRRHHDRPSTPTDTSSVGSVRPPSGADRAG